MKKGVSEYLDLVCTQIKSKQTRLSTRAELTGHINDMIAELGQDGLGEDEAVAVALERMGSPYEIGKQIASINSQGQNMLTAIAGSVLLFVIFLWQEVFYFFDLSAFVFVVLLTLAFVMIGGFSRLTRLSALTRGRIAALYAGGIGLIVGIIKMLTTLDDLSSLGPPFSFCITCMLYGLIVSAVLTSAAHFSRPLEGKEIRKILDWDDFEP